MTLSGKRCKQTLIDENLNHFNKKLFEIFNCIRLEREIKKSGQIFYSIRSAAAAWNEIFSTPVLLFITTRFITVSFGFFSLIQTLFFPVHWIEGGDKMFYFIFCSDFVMMVIVFTSEEMPTKEVKMIYF